MMNSNDIKKQMESVPFWWHSIDLGNGIKTHGHKTTRQLQNELNAMRLPDLNNKTVMDIGAWDGFYSFEAERRGASRVLALDHYVWRMDVPAMIKYWEEC